MLDRVKLRNRVLQQVIRLIVAHPTAKGRRGRRGRISYAQLGINQLGAVYEALLSYRGFFAEEDLYEVKKAGDPDDTAQERLVRGGARNLDDYKEEERVYDRDEEGHRKLRVHRQGPLHLSPRRPGPAEVGELLHAGVAHPLRSSSTALRELIPDDMPADPILDLTVCEPAMGSAAFLNEAVNQLAREVPGAQAARARQADSRTRTTRTSCSR